MIWPSSSVGRVFQPRRGQHRFGSSGYCQLACRLYPSHSNRYAPDIPTSCGYHRLACQMYPSLPNRYAPDLSAICGYCRLACRLYPSHPNRYAPDLSAISGYCQLACRLYPSHPNHYAPDLSAICACRQLLDCRKFCRETYGVFSVQHSSLSNLVFPQRFLNITAKVSMSGPPHVIKLRSVYARACSM